LNDPTGVRYLQTFDLFQVRDGKMGPARWAGPPARLKKYGPGHEFQPASPGQPGPSSPLARRASPRAKTGQSAGRKTKTGGISKLIFYFLWVFLIFIFMLVFEMQR